MGRGRADEGIEARENAIRLQFQWRGQRCRETLSLAPTPANLKYAQRLRGEILRKIEFGQFNYAEYFPNSKRLQKLGIGSPKAVSSLFGELAEQWLAASSHLAKSTLEGYRKTLTLHLMPSLAARPITEITYGELSGLLGSHTWGSMKTRNNTAIPLRRIFDTAFLDGLIPVNPAARLRNQKVQKAPPDPLTIDELNKVLALMGERWPEQVQNYFEFAFFTGLRTSELIALRWGDIDSQACLARVQRAKVRGEVKGTKTQQVRDVELNSRALQALHRQKAHTLLMDADIFHNPTTNQPYNDDKPPRIRYWTPALKLLGLRHRDAYQTRHTFATLNLMAGANPMWVSRQLGHTSMKMLLEVYSRWIDQADRSRERNKLEVMLSGEMGQTLGQPMRIQGNRGE